MRQTLVSLVIRPLWSKLLRAPVPSALPSSPGPGPGRLPALSPLDGRPTPDRSPALRREPGGRPCGADSGRGGRWLLSASVLLLVLGGVSVGQANEPALRFTSSTEFQVHPNLRLWPTGHAPGSDREGIKHVIFARLTAAQAAHDPLTFTVEGQSGEAMVYCHNRQCGAVAVGAVAEDGLLYLGVGFERNRAEVSIRSRFEDFPAQRVEVSVQAAGQQVYQEVRVTAPTTAPDCGDYPALSEDRYRCYFTREITPAAFRVANSPLVDALPGQLVQDRGEYALVFAEEFSGSYVPVDPDPDTETDTATYAATYGDTCDRGLVELDATKWSYPKKDCRATPEGPPCAYLAGGHLHASATNQCSLDLQTWGSFRPKYGYVEFQFTVHMTAPHWYYLNYNMILGDLRRAEWHLLGTHALSLDSLERLLTLVPWTEVDVLEYVPGSRYLTAHQYRNHHRVTNHPDLRPMRTNRNWTYCTGTGYCTGLGRLTITYGLEWTPRGYLVLRRVHGHEEVPQIWPRDTIEIQQSADRYYNGEWPNPTRYLRSAADREPYFVQLDPNDRAFSLEAVGISHVPLPISIGTWGSLGSAENRNVSQLTIDYLRVFQPRNRYADMEPLYQ